MARVPYLNREDLATEDRKYWDEIAASRGQVLPNFRALLNGPRAAAEIASLGTYVRFESSLDRRTTRLAAIVTSREVYGNYVWAVNLRNAGSDGIGEETIRVIREGRPLQELAPDDAIIAGFAQELIRNHRISDSTYAAAEQRLGAAGVVDLLVLIGYFWAVSYTFSALDIEPPAVL